MRLLLLLCLTWLLPVACLLSPDQKDSLIALYNATGGPSWSPHQWNLSSDPCTVPKWHGVVCNGSDVQSITLVFNNLGGFLPDLQLPALTYL